MRLGHVLTQLRRFGTVAGPDRDGAYHARVGSHRFLVPACGTPPARVTHLWWENGAGWAYASQLAPRLRAAVEWRRGLPLAGGKCGLVLYTLGRRALAEEVHVYTPAGQRGGRVRAARFNREDPVPFSLGKEFAHGRSDTFLDWLQDHRPELLA